MRLPIPGKKPFSAEDDKFIKDNWKSMSMQEIADALGRNVSSIKTHAYGTLMLCKKKKASSVGIEIARMARQGIEYKVIAETLGLTYSQVRSYVCSNKVKIK